MARAALGVRALGVKFVSVKRILRGEVIGHSGGPYHLNSNTNRRDFEHRLASNLPRPTAFLSWYAHKLDTHPILTKCITSGLISACGDFLCQAMLMINSENPQAYRIIPWKINETDGVTSSVGESSASFKESQRGLNLGQVGRFAILGAFLVAPVTHYWYGALSTTLFPGISVTTVAKRVLVDQFAFAPVIIATWLTCLWTLEQLSHDQDKEEIAKPTLQEAFPPILWSNWMIWIPAQAINFRYVPIKYQVLFGNVVALLWNMILSYQSTTRGREHIQKPTQEA